jgi:site-specific DNA-methyltransferase (adenine-specific)
MYVFTGNTNLRHVLNAAALHRFHEINHLIWKFNFGVYTRRKYVTSHYHILYYKKSPNAKITFNTNCRYGDKEKTSSGKSALYSDLEDVFHINKEYRPGEEKNQNKLPDALLEKLILYSSNPGDVVCDFFLGNFTTALVAKSLGRIPWGFEVNPVAYEKGLKKLNDLEVGYRLREIEWTHVTDSLFSK